MDNLQHEVVLVVDFGAQYSQLIARRVRECGVYCEIIPYNYTLDKIKAKNPKAIILSGGPNSVYAENTPSVDEGIFEMGIPVLGICYGDQGSGRCGGPCRQRGIRQDRCSAGQ